MANSASKLSDGCRRVWQRGAQLGARPRAKRLRPRRLPLLQGNRAASVSIPRRSLQSGQSRELLPSHRQCLYPGIWHDQSRGQHWHGRATADSVRVEIPVLSELRVEYGTDGKGKTQSFSVCSVHSVCSVLSLRFLDPLTENEMEPL